MNLNEFILSSMHLDELDVTTALECGVQQTTEVETFQQGKLII